MQIEWQESVLSWKIQQCYARQKTLLETQSLLDSITALAKEQQYKKYLTNEIKRNTRKYKISDHLALSFLWNAILWEIMQITENGSLVGEKWQCTMQQQMDMHLGYTCNILHDLYCYWPKQLGHCYAIPNLCCWTFYRQCDNRHMHVLSREHHLTWKNR